MLIVTSLALLELARCRLPNRPDFSPLVFRLAFKDSVAILPLAPTLIFVGVTFNSYPVMIQWATSLLCNRALGPNLSYP